MKSLALPAVFAAGLLVGSPAAPATPSVDDQIEATRSVLKADRQATVAASLQFTETEARAFWPIYHQYRAEMDKVGDGVKHLVIEYAGLYPEVPEERAKAMLKELSKLEARQADTRASYLKRIARVLPAVKTLRFAQVESRLDLAARAELAAAIPLVPIEGKFSGQLTGAAGFIEGTAGGVFVETLTITADVAAIDRKNRTVTVVSPEGIKRTVKVGPEAINFDQIRVGDELKIVATEELVVETMAPGQAGKDDAAAVVALAPKGAMPGGLIAEARQVTATVTTIDARKRTATLKFEDGRTKTLPVRPDVDLGKHKVGEEVVFLITEMIAISVSKP